MKHALIIFLKNPEPGKVKTRLSTRFTPEQAASLYRAMAEDVISVHSSGSDYDAFVFYSPAGDREAIRAWLGDDLDLCAQEGADLGERQYNAFRLVFAKGYERAVIIGTDCLDISPENLEATFGALGQSDLVIGPSEDGGYYLIGSRRAPEFLRDGIAWSTPHVREQLLERVKRSGMEYQLLERKFDIDTCEDVDRLHANSRLGEYAEKVPRTLVVLESLMEANK